MMILIVITMIMETIMNMLMMANDDVTDDTHLVFFPPWFLDKAATGEMCQGRVCPDNFTFCV